MLLFKKSCISFAILNIFKHALIQLWGTMSQACLLSIHAIARLVYLFLQSLNTVLSMSSWSLCHNSLYGILFVQMVVPSPFLSDYASFQPTLVSTSKAGRILVYSYQLHFLLPGLFWHSTVFPNVIQSGKGLSPSRI